MSKDKKSKGSQTDIGDGYPAFQLAKALRSKLTDSSQKNNKTEQWQRVISGMYSGNLQIGTRKPVSGVPVWATLEVVTGGFATGQLLAGGELLNDEIELARRLSFPLGPETRTLLNSYFLSEEGITFLLDHIERQAFSVDVPEQGALPAVAFLLEQNDVSGAEAILKEILPFFDELKFYPNFSISQSLSDKRVFLQPVRESLNKLKSVEPNPRILAQEYAIKIWIPLYDQLVSLLIETIAGELPSVKLEKSGKPFRSLEGRYEISGGFPGEVFPDDWLARATNLLEQHSKSLKQYPPSRNRLDEKFPHGRLLKVVRAYVDDAEQLSDHDRQYARLQIARYIAKRGLPSDTNLSKSRAEQKRQCQGPMYRDIADVLGKRLETLPQHQGLEDLSIANLAVTQNEATEKVPAGTPVPLHIARKIGRAQVATVEELVAQDYITSADLLAEVLPQTASSVRASNFVDEKLKHIYAAVYRAFRKRRSLLLLNLESQVKITELPWVVEIERYRSSSTAAKDLAKDVLTDVVELALCHFPHAILPSKFLQEVRALLKQAELGIPVVDEIALDIFQEHFSQRFADAAKVAAEMLEGSLYERYFNIDYAVFREAPLYVEGNVSVNEFSRICAARARPRTKSWSVANNGIIVEQQQILTTQNLAPLFKALDLKNKLGEKLIQMVKTSFAWICRRQQVPIFHRRAGLIMLKNTAYAWRQLVFYMSLLSENEQQELVGWLYTHLYQQSDVFRNRFEPVLQGLHLSASGRRLDEESSKEIRFLGWTTGDHPLMPSLKKS